MDFAFDAFVTAALETADGFVFALGDGTARFECGESLAAHENAAILAAAAHPSGKGVITGGDDGRVVWSQPGEVRELAALPGRWIDVLAVSPQSGLVAFAAGRELHVIDPATPNFHNTFVHARTVADIAFDPKGRRLAAATYGGAALWFARIADQKPLLLKWAGSHIALTFSPDGKFLVSSMQENQLHGWRLADAKDMRMGGYPAKVRSLAFLARGQAMATSGAGGAVIWPFGGGTGPMGKQAAEVGFEDGAMVTRVAATPETTIVAAGLSDGRVWVMDTAEGKRGFIREDTGEAVSALAITADGARIAWGCEDGAAGVAPSPLNG
jgi:WD40 repeat protein